MGYCWITIYLPPIGSAKVSKGRPQSLAGDLRPLVAYAEAKSCKLMFHYHGGFRACKAAGYDYSQRACGFSGTSQGFFDSRDGIHFSCITNIERHRLRPGTSLFALVKYDINHAVDGFFLTVGQLIPSVDQVLLLSSKVSASVPFVKKLCHCDA